MRFKRMTPNLSVKCISETVKFYQDTLGFNIKTLVSSDRDTVENKLIETRNYSYAMLEKDELCIMFIEEKIFKENIPLLEKQPMGASILLYIDVEKVDDFYLDLQKKEIEIVKELTTTWYGIREFYIKDCNGYIVAFAEQV